MPGFVFYSGPSQLDGAPIIGVLITTPTNRKTGAMHQTYIIRADVSPIAAARSGEDASICGDCKHRPIDGGACYVTLAHGPSAVFRAYMAGSYPYDAAAAAAACIGADVRLGSYGDPAAIPAAVWIKLLAGAAGHTGYTHQWRAPVAFELRSLCMASVDNPSEFELARAAGWRTFRVRAESDPIMPGEFICPASEEAGKRKQCADCLACDGAGRAGKASPVIIAHGSKRARFKTAA